MQPEVRFAPFWVFMVLDNSVGSFNKKTTHFGGEIIEILPPFFYK